MYKRQGHEIVDASRGELQGIRGKEIGFVPQDPMSSLDPVWSIGYQVEEAIKANGLASGRKAVRQRAIEVLEQAGLQNAAEPVSYTHLDVYKRQHY